MERDIGASAPSILPATLPRYPYVRGELGQGSSDEDDGDITADRLTTLDSIDEMICLVARGCSAGQWLAG